ncbi:aspartate/glutamate racemase family protein [Acidovorax cavernicola]|uniref:Amino acid racemase n=1 Tax=Acidovorax cavernicola TaxID=1675792 RepID=A0A9X8D5W0_9BURK|nr:amino acid racemase [Acidovorax cavernicola]RIX80262.1 amino acid racemase [Acidovorax cavernicola]
MKTAGLIGGVAWPSTLSYYRLLNEHIQRELGGLHSARCVIVSLDFADVIAAMTAGRPDDARAQMETAARQVRASGADLVAILANTGHFAADAVQAAAGVPLVHVARETGDHVAALYPSMRRLGLLATSFALDAPFFGQMLGEGAGFELVLPDAAQRRTLDAAIFGPLALGEAGEADAAVISTLCDDLVARGAQGIVLGCTELSVVKPWIACSVPLFDSTDIHARAIAREMTRA